MRLFLLLSALICVAHTATNFRFSTKLRLPEDSATQVFNNVAGFKLPTPLYYWRRVDYYDLCGFNCSGQGLVRSDYPDTSDPNYANLFERENNAGGQPNRYTRNGKVYWRDASGTEQAHYWGPFCHYDCSKVKSTPKGTPIDTNQAGQPSGLFNKYTASEYQARWGEPVDSKNEMSGFGFIPIDSDPLFIGQEVIIGQMIHYNRPVYSPADRFKLSFFLRIWSEESGKKTLLAANNYAWNFNVDETPNWQPQRACQGKIPSNLVGDESYVVGGAISWCPYKSVLVTPTSLNCNGKSFTFPKCPDNITFTQNIASNPTFVLNNVKYTLSLTGFRLAGSKTPSTYFFSEEGSVTVQDLYARVIAACPVECDQKNLKPIYNATTGVCECDCPPELKNTPCPEGQSRNATCDCSCPKCSDGTIPVYNAVTKSCPCPCALIKKCKAPQEIYDPKAPLTVPVGDEGKCGDCLCAHGTDICNGANFTTDKPPCVTCKCVLLDCAKSGGGVEADYVQDSNCNCTCAKTCNSQEIRNGTCGCQCKYKDCPSGLLSYTNFTKQTDCDCKCDRTALESFCASLNRPPVYEQYNFAKNTGKCHCGACPPPFTASTPLDQCKCPLNETECLKTIGSFGKFITDNKTVCRCECDQTQAKAHCDNLKLKFNSSSCSCIPCVETGEDSETKLNCTQNLHRYYVCSNKTTGNFSNETNGCGGCIPPFVNSTDECICPLNKFSCIPPNALAEYRPNVTLWNITGECKCNCVVDRSCENRTHYWNNTFCTCVPKPKEICIRDIVSECAAKGQVVSETCPANETANCCCVPCPAHDCCANSNITNCKMTLVKDGRTCNKCECVGNFTCAADECKITGPIVYTSNGTEGQCGCNKQASCVCDAAAKQTECEAKNEVAVITQNSCNCTCPPPKVIVNGSCVCNLDCGGCGRDDKECKCNVNEIANFTCPKFCEKVSAQDVCKCINDTDSNCQKTDCDLWSQTNCPTGSKVVFDNSTDPNTCKCESCPLTESNCTNNGTNLNKFRPAPECDCVCPHTSSNHPCKWYEEFNLSNCSCVPRTKCPDTDPDCCPIKKADCLALNRNHEIFFNNQTCGCGDCLGNWTNVNNSLVLTHNSTEKCDKCPSKCVGNFKSAPRATDECNFECVCDTFKLTCNKTCYQNQNITACECINVTSTCVCGDGIVDPFAGEKCDPGHKVGNGTITDPCCDPNTCQPKTVLSSCSVDPCKATGQCVRENANSSKLVCNQTAPLCPETDCNTLDACVVVNGKAQCNYIPSQNKTDCGNGQGKCNEWCVFNAATNTSSCQKRDIKCVPPPELKCELPCCLYACSDVTGECEARWFVNSTCSDGDVCTENDRCIPNPDASNITKVVCAGRKKCTDIINENPCKNVTCNAAGQCETVLLPDETPCENGDECQQGNKKCRKGECRGLAKICNTTNECVQVTCQRYRARARYGECIENPSALFNNPCDDGNNCTVNDYCGRNGTCMPGFDTCVENESFPILPVGIGAGLALAGAAVAALLVAMKTQASGITNAATWGVFEGQVVEDNPLFAPQTMTSESALYGQA